MQYATFIIIGQGSATNRFTRKEDLYIFWLIESAPSLPRQVVGLWLNRQVMHGSTICSWEVTERTLRHHSISQPGCFAWLPLYSQKECAEHGGANAGRQILSPSKFTLEGPKPPGQSKSRLFNAKQAMFSSKLQKDKLKDSKWHNHIELGWQSFDMCQISESSVTDLALMSSLQIIFLHSCWHLSVHTCDKGGKIKCTGSTPENAMRGGDRWW